MHLGIGTYLVPFIFVYHPALLLIGSPLEIVLAIGLAIIGIAALMTGLEGYMLGNLNVVQRILLAVGGIAFKGLADILPQMGTLEFQKLLDSGVSENLVYALARLAKLLNPEAAEVAEDQPEDVEPVE